MRIHRDPGPSVEILTGLVLLFSFLNGANDSGTMAASVISSRSLSPRQSVALAAAASFLGAVLLGSEVARTLGSGLMRLDRIQPAGGFAACPAAAGAAILWSLLVWRLALPGSYTHALLGGWLGAFVGVSGFGVVRWDQTGWVLLAVLLTPLAGLVAAWLAIRLLYRYGSELSMHAMPLFRALQVLLFAGLCFAHGANVAQKGMALLVAGQSLALGLGIPAAFTIPLWARMACSAAFSLGVLAGFSRVLKTVGFGIFRVDVLHSLCAIGSAGALVLASTAAGMPLSPGQINSSSLLGAGAGENARAVRWSVAGDLLLSWVLTFPACALLAFLLVQVVKFAG